MVRGLPDGLEDRLIIERERLVERDAEQIVKVRCSIEDAGRGAGDAGHDGADRTSNRRRRARGPAPSTPRACPQDGLGYTPAKASSRFDADRRERAGNEDRMTWTAPILEEISCGMEINMYFPADEEDADLFARREDADADASD